MAEQSFQRFPNRAAYIQMGRSPDLPTAGTAIRDFAAWLQKVAGLKRGDRMAIMLPNVLQYPIAMFARAACRTDGGQHQSALHRTGTGTPAHRRRLRGASWCSRTSRTYWRRCCRGRGESCHRHQRRGRLGFPKSAIVDFVVRRVRKQVPTWHIPGPLNSVRRWPRDERGLAPQDA